MAAKDIAYHDGFENILSEFESIKSIPTVGDLTEKNMLSMLDDLDYRGAFSVLPTISSMDDRSLMDKFTSKWKYNNHVYGFVPPSNNRDLDILPVAEIANHPSYQDHDGYDGKKFKITLERMKVADYPGFGNHNILFQFKANHFVEGKNEPLVFDQKMEIREGNSTAKVGYPIFNGIVPSINGIGFHCQTININNSIDEKLIKFLEGDELKKGLQLIDVVQPAIKPLSEISIEIAKQVLKRTRNRKVQDFYLGLDFDEQGTGARFAMGTYVVIQIPPNVERSWNWNDWKYDRSKGFLINKNNDNVVDYNYVIFRLSEFRTD